VELFLNSPNTPSWRGAQFKNEAQGQLYLYLYLYIYLYLYLWQNNDTIVLYI